MPYLKSESFSFLHCWVFREERMNDSITKRVDIQFWNREKILPFQKTISVQIQFFKPLMKPFQLAQRKPCIIT